MTQRPDHTASLAVMGPTSVQHCNNSSGIDLESTSFITGRIVCSLYSSALLKTKTRYESKMRQGAKCIRRVVSPGPCTTVHLTILVTRNLCSRSVNVNHRSIPGVLRALTVSSTMRWHLRPYSCDSFSFTKRSQIAAERPESEAERANAI
jgi:hypothetical protein